MRGWIIDLAVGIAIAALIIVVLLIVSFDSTFIYRATTQLVGWLLMVCVPSTVNPFI